MAQPAPSYTLADTWRVNNRVNLMLLGHLSDQQLALAANPRARSIADQFAHLHNVRIMWLEVQAPEVARTLGKIEKGAAGKDTLRQALEASGEAMAALFDRVEAGGKLKSAKRGVNVFFGYALAHEGHHRGQILLHLKNGGHRLDPMFGFSLWDWQKI